MFEANFTYDFEMLCDFNTCAMRKNRTKALPGIVILMLVILAALMIINGDYILAAGILLLDVLLAVFVLSSLSVKLSVKSGFKHGIYNTNTRYIKITGDEVVDQEPFQEMRLRYPAFKSIIISRRLIMLYTTNINAVIVPLSAFGKEEEAELRALIVKKAAEYNIPIEFMN